MTIVKWDPRGDIASLQDLIDKLFTDSFPNPMHDCAGVSPVAWKPAVDIYGTDQGIIITVDLPGVRKKNVVVEVEGERITIRGERFSDPLCQAHDYYRRERAWGNFIRIFTLSAAVPPEQISATLKNGLLILNIPQPETDPDTYIPIAIE